MELLFYGTMFFVMGSPLIGVMCFFIAWYFWSNRDRRPRAFPKLAIATLVVGLLFVVFGVFIYVQLEAH